MSHHAVLLRPSALTKSFVLLAERWEDVAGVRRFFRDGVLVHQVAACDVLRVESHPTDKQARDALMAFLRDSAGGATVKVQEGSAGKPRGRGRGGAPLAVPAEGISFRVEER
jgi:hypothetical protein